MDRLSQLRGGEAGGSRDSTLDTTSPPSEAFMTANESSSKYYSLSEEDSTFDISSMKDDISSIKEVSLANATTDSEGTMTNADELISNLSPIGKKSDILDSYKIDTQIEAANILSGGVAIFDDNDNSYDGHELVIDDNVDIDDKSNSELKQAESLQYKSDENIIDTSLISEEADIASKDTEVVLQIDGKNVDAIDIGNGLYLYRKEGQEELAAVQIIDDDQHQPSFKFLKVRENAEGNLEVYEEIEIEVPKEVPVKEGKMADKNLSSHVPIKDINKVISDSVCNKVADRKIKAPPKKEPTTTNIAVEPEDLEISPDSKSEVNLNGKMMKFSESRKSPVIGSFTPMTYHSTPNKEGIPLTKTMVDQQLHPNRHSDLSNVKKTIEVHTDSCKQKPIETLTKNKDTDDNKINEISSTEKEVITDEPNDKDIILVEEQDTEIIALKESSGIADSTNKTDENRVDDKTTKSTPEQKIDVPMEQDNAIDSTEKEVTQEKTEVVTQIDNANKDDDLIIEDELNIDETVDISEDKETEENEKIKDKGEFEKIAEKDDTNMIAQKEETKIIEQKEETKRIETQMPKIEENVVMDNIKDNPMVIEERDLVKDMNVVELIEVDSETVADIEISKDVPMDVDTETKLTIEEAPFSIESKLDGNTYIEEKQETQVKDVNNEQNELKIDADEPILIEDDDVSIVEVIVDSKEDKETNELSDSKNEAKLDGTTKDTEDPAKVLDNNASVDIDDTKSLEIISHDEDILNKEKVDTNSLSNTANKTSKNDIIKPVLVEEEIKKDIAVSSNIDTECKSNTLNITLVVQNKPNKDNISSPYTDIVKNDIKPKPLQLENKDVLIKSSISPPKVTSLLPKIDDGIQNNKPIETAEIKSAAPKEEPTRHIPANILEPRQKSSIALKVIPEKQTIPIARNVTIINKIVEPQFEGKMLDIIAKTEAGKGMKATKCPPIATQIQVSSSKVPLPVNLVAAKDKVITDSTVAPQKSIILIPVKNVTVDKRPPAFDIQPVLIKQKDDIRDTKLASKDIAFEKGRNVINIEITKVPKQEPAKTGTAARQDTSSTSGKVTSQSLKNKIEPKDNKKEIPKVAEPKPINNNHTAVPFGKWTEANRQEFLNKFKTKTSVTSSNSNQLKNSNDLNRRDVLKKIDSQRQSSNALSKSQEAGKLNMKAETPAFSNKPNILTKEPAESKIPQKTETVDIKAKSKNVTKTEVVPKTQSEQPQAVAGLSKKEICQTKGNVQNLIDKTIEGMIHRNVSSPKTQDEPKQNTTKEPSTQKTTKSQKSIQPIQPACDAKFDELEMKMNELHGIPFIERPPHELPQVPKAEIKSYSKVEKENPPIPIKTKIPNLLPFPNKTQQKGVKENVNEVDSEDDEIIEHEPITGDIDLNKKTPVVKVPAKEKLPLNTVPQIQQDKSTTDAAKKEPIITEKDFDKFARRNSITYENCLTVNFDGKEPHNVVQTVVEKDPSPKQSKSDAGRTESKAKLPNKVLNVAPNPQVAKPKPVSKVAEASDDGSDRNESNVQKAYKALTEKRKLASDYSITIIEDKPVKVLFMENTGAYAPANQLNVQGQDLSPAKRQIPDSNVAVGTGDSLDSDMVDSADDGRSQEDVRTKSTKHQRKQVLTPVDEPELELIEPRDLGIEVSPKKKRRTDDDKTTSNMKYPMRKKLYLLGSNANTEDKIGNPVEIIKNPLQETINLNDNGVAQKNPVSALDSLVKAAELIETQTENMNANIVSNPDSQPNTPVKRGRGRPRKYPLTTDGTVDKSKVISPSPQKKPRLIDAKAPKRDTVSDDSDSEGPIIKENWTMGKINENIVCPICNKLFRTENVVFKHVKHCTGPSPSRSDSDKRSPMRTRVSQDSDSKSRESKSDDMDIDDDKPLVTRKLTPKKRKSKDSEEPKSDDKDNIIVIEDTPIKEKPAKFEERKQHESRKSRTKLPHKSSDLVCEFCGKTFRQLSYLVSHKLQHKKNETAEPKKIEKDAAIANKPVYSCEVCKKEFRKLHHLVQHRIIHNPTSAPPRSSRKSSSEQSSESKIEKEPKTSKQSDDPSAGFRCEPCDKSFRKLHHLVEHRETHDGINRQKTTTAPPSKEEKPVEKPISLHQCDICKKTFKKVQLLKEHKELHVETSSEKSDDKSVKSSLSTRDIIHECSLCYMVFPNEHSLNKHTVFCQRKKRQSKQLKPADETEDGQEVIESPTPEEKIENVDSPIVLESINKDGEYPDVVEKEEAPKDTPTDKEKPAVIKEKSVEPIKNVEKDKIPQKVDEKAPELQVTPTKRDFVVLDTSTIETKPEVPEKIKKVELKEPVKIHETPKKKAPKDKIASATKRLKATAPAAKVTEEVKPVDSSDDDEVRYMLNPNFKPEDATEEKVFMKVRAKKRSSLQIERPNSKELVKRRTSLQYPPKIPRLKAKAVETNASTVKKEVKTPKPEVVPSTDSDDSETTKYSFPSTIPEKPTKAVQDRTPKDSERKSQKKSLADKRKSLIGIAKRKSLGKTAVARHKVTPVKPVKKRTLDVEHRCDCGQLFSSAALLSRHTTLAHTPPRIRRRRSPPPEEKPVVKPTPRKSADKPKQSPASRKSSARSDSTSNSKSSRTEVKSSLKSMDKATKSQSDARKAKLEKSEEKSSVKPRRTGAHRGVPVPEKMRKVIQKNK